jgi:hypothetical protein
MSEAGQSDLGASTPKAGEAAFMTTVPPVLGMLAAILHPIERRSVFKKDAR